MPKTKTKTTAITKSTLPDLVELASKGDATSIAQLRATSPKGLSVLLDHAGAIARRTEGVIIATLAGDNPLVREGVQRKLAALREELSGPHGTPLEALLIDNVVATWLQVQQADRFCATLELMNGIPDEMREHRDRWRDRAHGRHLRAIKSLATVRRLLLPAVQLNVAERQVNVLALAGDINKSDGSR